jgi:excisionase family DNA binding protein
VSRQVVVDAAALERQLRAVQAHQQRSRVLDPELSAALSALLVSSSPAPDPPPDYLTTAEAAALYRVNERTIRRWIAAGELEALRIGGTVRIPANSGHWWSGADAPPAPNDPPTDTERTGKGEAE